MGINNLDKNLIIECINFRLGLLDSSNFGYRDALADLRERLYESGVDTSVSAFPESLTHVSCKQSLLTKVLNKLGF